MKDIIKTHDSLFKKYPVTMAVIRSILVGGLAGLVTMLDAIVYNKTSIIFLSVGFNMYFNRRIYEANQETP